MAKLIVPMAQVGLNQLQGARLSPVDNGGEAIGRGLQQVSSVAQNIFLKERDEADKRVVLERTSSMRDKLNETWAFIESHVQGSKIKDPVEYGGQPGQSLTDRFTEVAQDLHKEFSSGLSSRQLAEFDQSMLPAMTALKSGVRQHEARQWRVMDDMEAKASHEKNITLTAAVGTPEALEAGVAESVRLAAMDAKRVGLDKVGAEMHQLSSTTAVIAPTLEKLMREGKSEQAKVLFGQYSSMLTPQAREKLEEAVGATVLANRARVLANKAGAMFGSDLVGARSWIESQAGDDAHLRAKADAEFKDLTNIVRTQTATREEEAVGEAYGQAMEARRAGRMLTTTQIDDLVLAAGVRGNHRLDVGKRIEYLFRGDPQEKAAAREARSEARAQKFIEYLVNPDKVAALSEKQIFALQHELGPEHTLSLARMKKTMEAQAGQLEVPAQLLNAAIKMTGMNPNKGSDAKLIAAARDTASQEILDTQKIKGRALDDNEKGAILRKNFRVSMVPGDVLGTFSPNKTLYGAVADKKRIVDALPEEERVQVMDLLRKRGRVVFDSTTKDYKFAGPAEDFLEIHQLWKANQKKGAK